MSLRAFGRYEAVRDLGRRKGRTFWGADPQHDRPVLIKAQPLQGNRALRDALIARTRLLAALDHPHIVPTFDVGITPDDFLYVVWEYIEGSNLYERTYYPASPEAFAGDAECFLHIAEALQFAHTRGTFHNNVRAGNILFNRQGTVFLADFQIAMEPSLSDDERIVYPRYPSHTNPEYLQNSQGPPTAQNDIWSFGVTLYERLTQQLPFERENVAQIFQAIIEQEPPPPRYYNDTIPPALEAIILRCLAKAPADRYQTMAHVAADLQAWLRSLPVPPLAEGSAHTPLRSIFPRSYLPISSEQLWTPRAFPLQLGPYAVSRVLYTSAAAMVVDAELVTRWETVDAGDPGDEITTSLEELTGEFVLPPQMPLAIKITRPGAPFSDGQLASALRTILGLSAVHSPHLVSIQNQGLLQLTDGECLYTVMEQRPWPTLINWTFRLEDAVAWPLRLEVAQQIALAMYAAHSIEFVDYQHVPQRGVIHGDLKPGNILIGPQHQPAILDFELDEAADARTARYGSEDEERSVARDILALGMTFDRMFYPHQPPLSFMLTRPTVHRELALHELLTWMIRSKPHERPASMAEVASLLAELRAYEP